MPDFRNGRKKRRMSSTSNSGSSSAAKCPPRGISVQRWTLKNREAHSRGGREMSFGNMANAAGTSVDPTHCLTASTVHVSASALTKSVYGRNDEPIVSVTQ